MTGQAGTAALGTELTRFNALRHGILTRYTVLPWEDPAEYQSLLEALRAEHNSRSVRQRSTLWRSLPG
jgi:hypothetical protein